MVGDSGLDESSVQDHSSNILDAAPSGQDSDERYALFMAPFQRIRETLKAKKKRSHKGMLLGCAVFTRKLLFIKKRVADEES